MRVLLARWLMLKRAVSRSFPLKGALLNDAGEGVTCAALTRDRRILRWRFPLRCEVIWRLEPHGSTAKKAHVSSEFVFLTSRNVNSWNCFPQSATRAFFSGAQR